METRFAGALAGAPDCTASNTSQSPMVNAGSLDISYLLLIRELDTSLNALASILAAFERCT